MKGVWLAIMRACTRSNALTRYPDQIKKVEHHFDDAGTFKFAEVDTEREGFNLMSWISANEGWICQILDIRSARTVLTEEQDWGLVLRHCQKLTEKSHFCRLVFAESTRRAMLKYLDTYISQTFEATLQGWAKMTKQRNNEALQRIRAEMTRMGITRELQGLRSSWMTCAGREFSITTKSVAHMIDLHWGGHLRDAARGHGLHDLALDGLLGSPAPHVFGQLVGKDVLKEVNEARQELEQKIDLAKVKDEDALLRLIKKHEEDLMSIDTAIEVELWMLRSATGTQGLDHAHELILGTFPTVQRFIDEAGVLKSLDDLKKHIAIKLGGEVAANHLASVRKVVACLCDMEVPSETILYSNEFMRRMAQRCGNFIRYDDTSVQPAVILCGKDALTVIIKELWAHAEMPEGNGGVTHKDLDLLGPYKFLMTDEQVEVVARVRGILRERQAATRGMQPKSIAPLKKQKVDDKKLTSAGKGAASSSKDKPASKPGQRLSRGMFF